MQSSIWILDFIIIVTKMRSVLRGAKGGEGINCKGIQGNFLRCEMVLYMWLGTTRLLYKVTIAIKVLVIRGAEQVETVTVMATAVMTRYWTHRASGTVISPLDALPHTVFKAAIWGEGCCSPSYTWGNRTPESLIIPLVNRSGWPPSLCS